MTVAVVLHGDARRDLRSILRETSPSSASAPRRRDHGFRRPPLWTPAEAGSGRDLAWLRYRRARLGNAAPENETDRHRPRPESPLSCGRKRRWKLPNQPNILPTESNRRKASTVQNVVNQVRQVVCVHRVRRLNAVSRLHRTIPMIDWLIAEALIA